MLKFSIIFWIVITFFSILFVYAPIAFGSGGEEGLTNFIFTTHLFITLIYCLKKSYAK